MDAVIARAPVGTPAGVQTEVVSRTASKLRAHTKIFYDPLLPVATVKAAVIASISAYLARLEFDGQVYVARLEDAVQASPGVKNVKIVSVMVRVSAPGTPVDRVYETQAGYVEPEDAPGYTLADLLVFTPLRVMANPNTLAPVPLHHRVRFADLTAQLLPALLRRPRLLAWLAALLAPLETLYQEFATYQRGTFRRLACSTHTLVFEEDWHDRFAPSCAASAS